MRKFENLLWIYFYDYESISNLILNFLVIYKDLLQIE